MRKLNRSQVAQPAEFLSSAVSTARRAIADYLKLDPTRRQQIRAPINESIFYSSQIRAKAHELSFGKCAFCETPLDAGGNVHHFRPITGAADLNGLRDKDHYCWLAYEWQNIYAACGPCTKAKRNLFPVRGPRAGLLSTFDEVREQEAAQLVDPCFESPAWHFRFLHDGRCEPLTTRGSITLSVFDLNRSELVDSRQRAFARLDAAWPSIDFSNIHVLEAIFRPEREHYGALSDFLKRVMARWRRSDSLAGTSRDELARVLVRRLRQLPLEDLQQLARSYRETVAADEAVNSDLWRGAIFSLEPTVPTARMLAPVAKQLWRAADNEVRSITLTNFKGIRKLELRMPPRRSSRGGAPCLMLLGENAAGKSSILEGVALALIGAREARKLPVRPSNLLRRENPNRWELYEPVNAQAVVNFYDHSQPAEIGVDALRTRWEGSLEPATIVLGYGPRRYISPKHRTRARSPKALVQSLFDPLAVIPHPGEWLRQLEPAKFEAVARALRFVLTLGDEDELVIDDMLGACVVANGLRTPIDRLSEGYRSVFALVCDICRELIASGWSTLEEAQGVVLVDEIETHLHPRWKMRIMSSLRRALPRVQFIATTHDPLCLRGMDDEEVLVLQRGHSQEIELVDDLPSVKGMRADQLLTSEYFGLASTEDVDLERAAASYAAGVLDGRETVPEPTEADVGLIARLVVGDTARQQIIHEALDQYLRNRRTRTIAPGNAHKEAVRAVLAALSDSGVEED